MTDSPTPPPTPAAEVSPLGVLGFTGPQERLYRLVLRNSGCEVTELARLAGLSVAEMREHVTRFVLAGVVELHDETVLPLPPQQALARLINDEARRVRNRSEQIRAVREMLPSLSADHLAGTAPQGDPVTIEVLEGGDVVQLVRRLSADSSGELLWLRPDPWKIEPGHEIDDWVIDLIRSGRTSRAIYQVDVLRHAPEVIRRRAEAGEQVRVLPRVPTRLAVLGTSAALIGEQFEVVGRRRLVLRHHSLVVALALAFEGLWERATAVPGLDGGRSASGASEQRPLLTQLTGGAKDEQIARALGISVRTVRRRVADLLDELGVGSRFQAGVEAARRGWV